MATETITAPVILDSTGQSIVSAIQGVAAACKPDATEINMGPSDSTKVSAAIASANTAISNKVMKTSAAFSIPSSGNSVTKSMTGLTADYQLVRWNFSSSAENNPPVNMTWTTSSGSFTISNTGGTTSETIQPVFALPTAVAAT